MLHDGLSEFQFLQALAPQDLPDAGGTDGVTIDTRGYQTVTFIVNVGDYTGGGAFSADNRHQLMLEHALESAAGLPSVWSEVYPSQMLHSVTGMGGAYSTLNSGIFASVTSADVGVVHRVGYIGPRRLVRLRVSNVGAPSVMSMGAVCILGKPGIWPVQDPLPH